MSKCRIQAFMFIVALSISPLWADWSISAIDQIDMDRNGYSLQQHQGQLVWANETTSWFTQAEWSQYALDSTLDGVYEFNGYEWSVRTGIQKLSGLWWWQLDGGLQGDLKGWTSSATLARVLLFPDIKYTPRLTLSRSALAQQPLALSLQSFKREILVGTAWENSSHVGDAQIQFQQWESVNLVGRSRNTLLQFTSTPIIAQGSVWWMPKEKSALDLGWSLQGQWSDQSVNYATQVNPVYLWTFFPLSMPRWGAAVNAQVRSQHIQSQLVSWSSTLGLPLLSLENRQWGIRQKTDWGTAAIRLQSQLTFSWNTLQWHLGADLQSKPWNHYVFWTQDAWMQFSLQSNLSKSF